MLSDVGPEFLEMPILGFVGFLISLIMGVFTALKYMGND
jgi:ubiquinone biosynthesis protein